MRIIYTTFSDKKMAESMAERLLKKRLIACAQISAISSLYMWEGAMQRENEFLLTCKLSAKNVKKASKIIHKFHEYKLPEFIVLKPKNASKKYKKWVKSM